MAEEVKKLRDVLPPEHKVQTMHVPQELVNREITIHGFQTLDGDYGTYALIQITCPIHGERCLLRTGAARIMEILEFLEEAGAFPVQAKVVSIGRRGWGLE